MYSGWLSISNLAVVSQVLFPKAGSRLSQQRERSTTSTTRIKQRLGWTHGLTRALVSAMNALCLCTFVKRNTTQQTHTHPTVTHNLKYHDNYGPIFPLFHEIMSGMSANHLLYYSLLLECAVRGSVFYIIITSIVLSVTFF